MHELQNVQNLCRGCCRAWLETQETIIWPWIPQFHVKAYCAKYYLYPGDKFICSITILWRKVQGLADFGCKVVPDETRRATNILMQRCLTGEVTIFSLMIFISSKRTQTIWVTIQESMCDMKNVYVICQLCNLHRCFKKDSNMSSISCNINLYKVNDFGLCRKVNVQLSGQHPKIFKKAPSWLIWQNTAHIKEFHKNNWKKSSLSRCTDCCYKIFQVQLNLLVKIK